MKEERQKALIMKIELSAQIMERLEKEAARRGWTVEETVIQLLEWHLPSANPATLADLAEIALRAGMSTGEPVDTADRSRAILDAEFAHSVEREIRQ